MYLLVKFVDDEAQVTLEDADNFHDLHVESAGLSPTALGSAIEQAGFGRVDGEFAWLDTAALRRHGQDTAVWQQQYDDMLKFAARSGWMTADGSSVQAHVT